MLHVKKNKAKKKQKQEYTVLSVSHSHITGTCQVLLNYSLQ